MTAATRSQPAQERQVRCRGCSSCTEYQPGTPPAEPTDPELAIQIGCSVCHAAPREPCRAAEGDLLAHSHGARQELARQLERDLKRSSAP